MYLLKRSLCEDESQKDFEREDEYNEANTGPLKSQERFFLNKTVAFLCVSETFGARKGISGNAHHHVHQYIFLSFTLKLS